MPGAREDGAADMRRRPSRHAARAPGPSVAGARDSAAPASRAEAQAIVDGLRVFNNREWQVAEESRQWWEDLTALSYTRLQCCAFCGLCVFPQVWLPAHEGQKAQFSTGTHLQGTVRVAGAQAGSGPAELAGTPFSSVSPVCAGPTPPYARQCSALRNACVTPEGDWRVCRVCKENPKQREALQTTVTPELVADLLGVDPVEAQVRAPRPAQPRQP